VSDLQPVGNCFNPTYINTVKGILNMKESIERVFAPTDVIIPGSVPWYDPDNITGPGA
jgi:hypothetical protein